MGATSVADDGDWVDTVIAVPLGLKVVKVEGEEVVGCVETAPLCSSEGDESVGDKVGNIVGASTGRDGSCVGPALVGYLVGAPSVGYCVVSSMLSTLEGLTVLGASVDAGSGSLVGFKTVGVGLNVDGKPSGVGFAVSSSPRRVPVGYIVGGVMVGHADIVGYIVGEETVGHEVESVVSTVVGLLVSPGSLVGSNMVGVGLVVEGKPSGVGFVVTSSISDEGVLLSKVVGEFGNIVGLPAVGHSVTVG